MAIQREKSVEERVFALEFEKETTERHLREVREVGTKTAKDVVDIKNAIIGSSMNGDYGLVHEVKGIKNKQDDHEDILITHKVYFKQMGFIIGAVVVAVIGLVITVIKSKV